MIAFECFQLAEPTDSMFPFRRVSIRLIDIECVGGQGALCIVWTRPDSRDTTTLQISFFGIFLSRLFPLLLLETSMSQKISQFISRQLTKKRKFARSDGYSAWQWRKSFSSPLRLVLCASLIKWKWFKLIKNTELSASQRTEDASARYSSLFIKTLRQLGELGRMSGQSDQLTRCFGIRNAGIHEIFDLFCLRFRSKLIEIN